MKIIILVIFTTLFCICLHAQTLTMKDLKKIYSARLDDAETLILKKKFAYVKTEEPDSSNNFSTIITYGYGMNTLGGSSVQKAVFLIRNNTGLKSVIYQTDNKDDYISIRNFCKKHRYKLTDTSSKNESIEYNYVNAIWHLKLENYIETGASGNNEATYSITITKNAADKGKRQK